MNLPRWTTFVSAALLCAFGACDDDEQTPARTLSALSQSETEQACSRIASATTAPTTCQFLGLLASAAWTLRAPSTDEPATQAVAVSAPAEDELRGVCLAASERCAQGLLPCPLAEFTEQGCDVSLDRLLQCYDESVSTVERLLLGAPTCDALTGADVLAFAMQDPGARRACDLVDFECEQSIDLSIQVASPPPGEPPPRACQGFDGVCGRCAVRRCRAEIQDCCGDALCVAAWSRYEACVITRWNGRIASYAAVQQRCRLQELAGSADEMYACRERSAKRECYTQCPVFDRNE